MVSTPFELCLSLEHIIVEMIEFKISPSICEAAVAVLFAELGRPSQPPVLVERREGNKRAALGLFFFLAELNENGFPVLDAWLMDMSVEIMH